MNRYVLTLVFVTFFTLGAYAADAVKSSTATSELGDNTFTNLDEAVKVLINLHHTNLTEIEMGKLASEKGVKTSVREYGKALVDDHEQLEKRVKVLAEEMGIEVGPNGEALDKKIRDKMTTLKKTKGTSFDREFIAFMVDDHKKLVEELTASRNNLSGSAAELIDETLPILKEHLATAEQLLLTVKGGTKPS